MDITKQQITGSKDYLVGYFSIVVIFQIKIDFVLIISVEFTIFIIFSN